MLAMRREKIGVCFVVGCLLVGCSGGGSTSGGGSESAPTTSAMTSATTTATQSVQQEAAVVGEHRDALFKDLGQTDCAVVQGDALNPRKLGPPGFEQDSGLINASFDCSTETHTIEKDTAALSLALERTTPPPKLSTLVAETRAAAQAVNDSAQALDQCLGNAAVTPAKMAKCDFKKYSTDNDALKAKLASWAAFLGR
jgi:hypothetical protein